MRKKAPAKRYRRIYIYVTINFHRKQFLIFGKKTEKRRIDGRKFDAPYSKERYMKAQNGKTVRWQAIKTVVLRCFLRSLSTVIVYAEVNWKTMDRIHKM